MAKRFKWPAVGTQLPPLENDLDYPSANDQNAVNMYLMRAAQQTALDRTDIVKEEYLNDFKLRWFVQYDSGRMFGPKGQGDPDVAPPKPPQSFMAVLMQASASFYWDIQQIGPPVCEIPEYKKITPPQHGY